MLPVPLGKLPSPALPFRLSVFEHDPEAMLRPVRPGRLKETRVFQGGRLRIRRNIVRSRCATLAEPPDPDIELPAGLRKFRPDTGFVDPIDAPTPPREIAAHLSGSAPPLPLMVDVDCESTGTRPGPAPESRYRALAAQFSLFPASLHVRDGHLGIRNPRQRKVRWQAAMEPVIESPNLQRTEGLPVPGLADGSSSTLHAECPQVTRRSPGTTLLREVIPDLPLEPAAFLRPGESASRITTGPARIRNASRWRSPRPGPGRHSMTCSSARNTR